TAGCILAATPFLLGHGASQYADIVICCFMTAAVVLYTVHDLGSTEAPLPLLAGITAAAAACTKNEGILFLCLLLASRLTAFLIRKTWREGCRELLSFTSGASLGLLTLAIFKMAYAPPNEIRTLLMSTHVVLERVRDARLHMQILGG